MFITLHARTNIQNLRRTVEVNEEMKEPVNKWASGLRRQLNNKKRATQMANNYIECSVSLAIRETQIKTTLR